MAQENKSGAQQRIDNAIYGTPKIKPDEQRKYLGTFRERVCLTISVAELRQQDWTTALKKELNRGIGQLVFINGNLPHEEIHPYIKAASETGGQFTLKTEPQFKTNDSDLAIVVAAQEAVYQSPVDVIKRYPDFVQSSNQSLEQPKAHRFWHDLFHRKDQA